MNAFNDAVKTLACIADDDAVSSKAAFRDPPGEPECDAIPDQAEIIKSGWGGSRANTGGARPGAGRPRGPDYSPKLEPIVTRPIGLRWYAVETHPQAERRAVYDMARQGWRGYLPLAATRRRDRVVHTMWHKVILPYMPGFVFVEFDRDGLTWGTIREYCNGVRGIIRTPGSNRPAPLPMEFIPDLMADDAKRLDLAKSQNPARAVGSRVRISVGAMTSFVGPVVACDGLVTTVNVELFGRLVPIEMAWDQVEDVK